MFKVLQTATFRRWLHGLKDDRAVARIVSRLRRAAQGGLGDIRSIGDGVSEMRVHYGPGYRLYFTRRDSNIVILLCGGDKGSQRRDVSRAKQIAAELEG